MNIAPKAGVPRGPVSQMPKVSRPSESSPGSSQTTPSPELKLQRPANARSSAHFGPAELLSLSAIPPNAGLRLVPQTTVQEIVKAALEYRAARPKSAANNEIGLFLSAEGQLSFCPNADSQATQADANVREALVVATDNQFRTDAVCLAHADPEESRAWAEEIVSYVLGDRFVSTFTQLLDLLTKTRLVAKPPKGDPTPEMMEIRGATMLRTRPSINTVISGTQGDVEGLQDLEPLLPACYQLEIGRQLGEANGPDVQTYGVFQSFIAFLLGGATPGDIEPGCNLRMKIGMAPILQYASLEVLSNFKGTKGLHASRFVESFPVMHPAAFGHIFLAGDLLEALSQASRKMACAWPREAWEATRMSEKIRILARNTKRFEAMRHSPMGAVRSLDDVSREFCVTMFERSKGRFDPALCSNKAPLIQYARSRAVGSAPAEFEATLPTASVHDWRDARIETWRLQSALCELTDADDVSQQDKWKLAASDFRMAKVEHFRHLFAFEDATAGLETVLMRKVGGGPLTRYDSTKLEMLKRNARRMEEFMNSRTSRNPNFDDVERAVLIPWWEAVKDVVEHPDWESTHNDLYEAPKAVAEVMHTQPAVEKTGSKSGPAAEKNRSRAPVQTPAFKGPLPPLPAVAAVAAQSLPSSYARAGHVSTATPASSELPDVAQVRQPKIKTRGIPIPMDPETKQASDAPSPLSTTATEQQAPRLLLRAAQRLQSADPLRTDRAPTGKERERRNSRADHHDTSRFKWLPTRVRELRKAQADSALPVMKRAG